MERDYKGNIVPPDKKLEKVKLSDDIIFVERHDAEFYVFSKAAVSTAGEAMHFICPKQWKPYEKKYDNPELCEISYHHPEGFYVRALVSTISVMNTKMAIQKIPQAFHGVSITINASSTTHCKSSINTMSRCHLMIRKAFYMTGKQAYASRLQRF